VLARDAVPPSTLAQRVMKRVEELGYDRWALRITRQG
jgi:apolipoprotein D and lipocalin family protein